jgi:hypothetical protein
MAITTVLNNFSIGEAFFLLKPVFLFLIGVAVYSVFIFKFYKFIARREIFSLNHEEGEGIKNFFGALFYFLKYIILFPLFTFFWFLVFAIILAFLSKQNDISIVLLISIALVGTIRIVSYYSEDLSKDLAKMLPFALLGVFLVDVSYFSLPNSVELFKQIPLMWKEVSYYLVFIVLLEFILRIIYGISRLFVIEKDKG